MNRFLLIDFGASFVKYAFFTKNTNTFYNVGQHPSSSISNGEINIDELQKLFNVIALSDEYDAILICSQMHGFALKKNATFLTNYISWMKQLPIKNKKEYHNINGIYSFDGIPIYNVKQLSKNRKVKFVSLTETLCDSKCVHNTLFCGSGFYDVKNNIISKKIVNDINKNLIFNDVVSSFEISGYFNNKPVYCGFGDLQCSLYGSRLKAHQLSINIGTGSQISIINDTIYKKTENRNYFDNLYLNTITHIPSGRSLNTFINFLNQINKQDYFSILNNISMKQILNSDLNIDLNVFGGMTGSITNITETNFTNDNFYAALLKSFIEQYLKLILLNFKSKYNSIILSGGISYRIPIIKEYIQEKLNTPVICNETNIQNTIIGLSLLSQKL